MSFIHETSKLISDDITIGDNVEIGPNVVIKSSKITIGDNTTIESNLKAHAPDGFSVGRCSWFTKDVKIVARKFSIGEYAVVLDGVEVGGGGSSGPNSVVEIGDRVMIGDNAVINNSEKVTIGNDVGIGAEVRVWTHGGYLQILDGFPSQFAPVTIGDNVWLTGKSHVLPGVTIGDNVVISMMSLVNKDLPNGCLAGGVPCKVIREDVYPRELSDEEQMSIVKGVVDEWKSMWDYKGITGVSVSVSDGIIVLEDELSEELSVIDYKKRTIEGSGKKNDITEDLRDFLRRKGIKIYTGARFQSITPTIFK